VIHLWYTLPVSGHHISRRGAVAWATYSTCIIAQPFRRLQRVLHVPVAIVCAPYDTLSTQVTGHPASPGICSRVLADHSLSLSLPPALCYRVCGWHFPEVTPGVGPPTVTVPTHPAGNRFGRLIAGDCEPPPSLGRDVPWKRES